ncbi:hypothetical protein GCM10009677_20590 [Sphaerisporangium rubeum]
MADPRRTRDVDGAGVAEALCGDHLAGGFEQIFPAYPAKSSCHRGNPSAAEAVERGKTVVLPVACLGESAVVMLKAAAFDSRLR